jgi:hypothetical protein
MSNAYQDDDFTPQEAQERFEAALRGALKTRPIPASSMKKGEAGKSPASSATAKTAPPRS